ncbi:MAG: aldo/keto reductase [Paludibacteraceae bacterium]|nr:aldo/keto reductase [Paludibacteraceae bacterium]
MKSITINQTKTAVPAIAMGCMRIADKSVKEVEEYICFCMEQGLNFFDHADIYGGGVCEEKFGTALKSLKIEREKLILQSKCSIVPGIMYDMSKEHILSAVDGILCRLKCDYLDFLLLHRPDALVEPEDVAEAFDILSSTGKVRNFGVSNHKPMQIELLKKYVKQPLVIDQLQLSIPVSNMITNGMEVNMSTEGSIDHDGSILDYCRLNDITIQAWSPFQYGFFDGPFIGNYDKFNDLNNVLNRLAEQYKATPTGIAIAWMMRHPAKIQTIAGTTTISRIQEIINGSNIELSRQEWYELYLKAGHILP